MTAAQTPHEQVLTPAEVAALAYVDPKTVSRWAAAGKIPSTRTPGGHRRFRCADVQDLLAHGGPPRRSRLGAPGDAPGRRTPSPPGVAETAPTSPGLAVDDLARTSSETVCAAATVQAAAAAVATHTDLAVARVARAVADAAAHVG